MNARVQTMILFIAVLVGCSPVLGHPLAPVLLELHELAGGGVAVRFKKPLDVPPWVELQPRLPEHCRALERLAEQDGADLSLTRRFRLDCGAGGLVGSTVGVAGLAAERMQALLRIELADGRTFAAVLSAGRPDFRVPTRQGVLAVGRQYVALGYHHILGGLDHLLFILGLLFLVTGTRKLVATVTAFTVGHSINLALAALGVVPLAQGPAEVGIAMTLVVLAVELTGEEATAWRRRPWLLAGLFGLLHGLGFAGALTQAGLPQGEIPLALASFNVGIEAGQLLFVLAFVGISRAGRRLGARAGGLAERLAGIAVHLPLAAAYVVGTLGVYWGCARLWVLWR